ncbi:MAG: Glu-tRNA(Gln) amidotransferase subunit GatD [Candidatus Aenigmarchaeota archaeon]|nr:Glu-tRNA(Gln) amidotransferase subunit GatD [Candidatus Aenigmarchaeota archaeon]
MDDNYSKEVQAILKKDKIEIGQRIAVQKGSESYEGFLMPKSAGDANCIVLKMDNGYNIGIAIKGAKIKKLHEKRDVGNIKRELPKFDKNKPRVSLITTGGTITSRVDYKTGAVVSLMKPEELLYNVPELANIVNLDIISPFTKMSEDMAPDDWQKIAKIAATELNKDNKGVIITHGTDTLHFTSAALSFMLPNLTKPVVLAGAQRSSDRGSADTSMNLICSAYAAISDIAEVGICMHGSANDDYCLFTRGTKVRKMHTSRRDAFRPINDMPIAKILPSGNIEIMNYYKKRSDGAVRADTAFEEKVALVKAYPGSDPDYLKFFVDNKYKGIVVEGTGLGHVPTSSKKSWIPAIKAAIKSGIPVVITSQTLYGRVNPNVYTNLRILFDTGAIPGEDMLPETAYIKLGWVLGHTKKPEEIRRLMLTNLVGEISERTDMRAFLN